MGVFRERYNGRIQAKGLELRSISSGREISISRYIEQHNG
jgi:hypothetical protein